MKSILTLLSVMLLTTAALFAQQINVSEQNFTHPAHIPNISTKMPPGLMEQARHNNINSRSASTNDTLILYYPNYDQVYYQVDLGYDFTGEGSNTPTSIMNSFVDTNHFGMYPFVAAVFDTIVYTTSAGGGTNGYLPLTGSTVTLDSIGVLLQLYGNIKNMLHDSIVISIFSVSNYYPNANLASYTLQKTIVYSDTTMLRPFFSSNGYIPYNVVPVNVQLPPNQGFVVGINYLNKVDTSYLLFFNAYADSCGAPTVTIGANSGTIQTAVASALGRVTQYDITGYSGNTLGAIATTNIDYGYFGLEGPPNYLPPTCAFLPLQDVIMFPLIHISTPYLVQIAASTITACPTSEVSLTASVYGTNTSNANLNYTWNVSGNGAQLVSTDGAQTTLIVGASGDDVVYVSVTDPNNGNALVVDSVVIKNVAPVISMANLTLNCNTNGVLVVNTSGSTISRQGIKYQWSDGSTTPATLRVNSQQPGPPYNYAGTYTVTVTNTWTCTATASATVSYSNANGVTNNVNFNVTPSPTYSTPRIATFENISTYYQSPWTASLDPDNTGSNVVNDNNGTQNITYTYPSPGTYTVTLIMDSNGCQFAHSRVVQVVRPPVGVENIAFDNNISIIPNPSNGNVNMIIKGAEKNISILVYNIVGEEVKTFSATDVTDNYSKTFDFSNLASGAYLVKVQSGNQTAIKKMLISR